MPLQPLVYYIPCLALASWWLPGWPFPNSPTSNCLVLTPVPDLIAIALGALQAWWAGPYDGNTCASARRSALQTKTQIGDMHPAGRRLAIRERAESKTPCAEQLQLQGPAPAPAPRFIAIAAQLGSGSAGYGPGAAGMALPRAAPRPGFGYAPHPKGNPEAIIRPEWN